MSTNPANSCSPSETPKSNNPSLVGADSVPNLSLPKTVLSRVDDLIPKTRVIQSSSQNLTIHNSDLTVNLLGGLLPHDDIRSFDQRMLVPNSLWRAEVFVNGVWQPLLPITSEFTILGTNRTGTYVARTMNVSRAADSGTLKIIYKATSTGSLKWDLVFSPLNAGHYRLTYTISNVAQSLVSNTGNQLVLGFGSTRVTLSWTDVAASWNATGILAQNGFVLALDLGTLTTGSQVEIDPSIVANGLSCGMSCSAYRFQRRVFYEPSGGYYWVFYWDGTNNVYRNSHDGSQWSAPVVVPSSVNTQAPWDPDIFNFGQAVIIASGSQNTGTCSSPCSVSTILSYYVGTIVGPNISWGSLQTGDTISRTCNNGNPGSSCTATVGIRYVDAVLTGSGQLAFSYNLYDSGPGTGYCSSNSAESGIIVADNGGRVTASCEADPNGYLYMESIVLPSNSQSQVRVVYEYWITTGGQLTAQQLQSRSFDGVNAGPTDSLGGIMGASDTISGVSDANYGVHVLFSGSDGNTTYAYLSSSAGSSWTYSLNIFTGSDQPAVITADYSTNDVYAFAIRGSSIVMKTKSLSGSWSDRSMIFPVTGRTAPIELGSNFASSSSTAANQALLIWSEGSGPYSVAFASIPMETVWSPYAAPSDPWDGNGLAPYGQYFSNLGEYVSPSTGMLTIRQTDLTVPGRGINLAFTRIYTEPYSFLNNSPYNYEKDPWAPMGSGWQLDFPWLNNTNNPLYIHLWDGQGYRIPSSLWTGSPVSFENSQGEHFVLSRNFFDGSLVLYVKSGTSYHFDPSHRLTTIVDSTGNNTITFSYTNNLISCITDTVGRAFSFSYSSGLLQSINQINGSCSNQGSIIRSITYGNNGQTITSESDPVNRITTYGYQGGPSAVAPWLLSRITYPTGWYANYTYGPVPLGTQATTYRVTLQLVRSSTNFPIRQFGYSYTQSGGDQITGAVVAAYNGTQLQTYTSYAFSFLGDSVNTTDANHNLLRGTQEIFGVNGQIPKEVVLVSDGQGHLGSYTNYYQYDLWGNRIYSRQVINPSTNWYHENYNAYYNNYLPAALDSYEQGHFYGAFYGLNPSGGSSAATGAAQSFNFTGSATTIGNVYLYLWYLPPSGTVDNGLLWVDLYLGSNQADPTKALASGSSLARSACCVYARDVPSAPGLVRFTFPANSYVMQPGTVYVLALTGQFTTTASQYVYVGGGLTQAHRGIGSYEVGTTWYMFGSGVNDVFYVYGASQSLNNFYAFQDSFSRNQWSSPDNPWSVQNGYWMVKEGSYNGTETKGYQESIFASYDLNKTDISLQAQVYINRQINASDQRIGIFSHNPGTGTNKWALVLHNRGPGGTFLELLDEWNIWLGDSQPSAKTSCAITTGVWYTFNFTVHGFFASGWAAKAGQSPCVVSGAFPPSSPAASGSRFGLYAGGYSALFEHVVATAINPFLTTTGFSNSFYPSGAPSPRFHTSLAGSAELANGTSTVPIETYYGYYMWGALNKETKRFDPHATPGTTNPLAIDGSSAAACSNTTSSCSTTLTTIHPNDIIIAYASETLDLQTTCSFSVSDTAGLSWMIRSKSVSGNGIRDQFQEFWALAPVALSSDTITERIVGCGTNYNSLQVFGVSGANTSTPFDPGYGLPASASGNSYGMSVPLTTTNSNDILVAGTQHGGSPTPTAGQGFTLLLGVGGFSLATEYETVNALVTNLPATFGDTYSASWEEIGDALQSTPQTSWITTSRTYDFFGNLVTVTDTRGNSTTLGYSSKYQYAYLTSQTLTLIPSSKVIVSSFGYNLTTGARIWAQQPSGYNTNSYNTTYTYDILGRQTKITYPVGAQTYRLNLQGFDYDGAGEESLTLNGHFLTSLPGVNSPQNAQKNVTFTVPLNSLVTQGANTLVFTHAQWDCQVNDYTHDVQILSNTTVVFSDYSVHPLNCSQSISYAFNVGPDYVAYTYNDQANYVNVTNENGWKTQQIYDGLGRLVSTRRFLAGVPYSNESSTYNAMNQVTASTDALGYKVTYQYDGLGRITRVTHPDGNFTQEFYNDTASWVRFTNEYGGQTGNYRCTVNDRQGRLISVVEAADIKCQTGIVTNYYYDEVGSLTRIINANQQSTLYLYDNLSRLTQTTFGDGTTELYVYDPSGNVIKKTDRNGVKTLFGYDSLNRPLTITFCGTTTASQSYAYDLNGNMLSLQNQNVTLSYTYDSRNRTVNETYTVNPASRQVVDLGCSGIGGTTTTSGGISRTYTVGILHAGEALGVISYPTTSGSSQDVTVNYAYDSLGRILNVTQLGSNTYYARSFTYNKNSQVQGLQFGNNLVENYTYDRLSRPQTITLSGTTTMNLRYSYNKTGTVSSVTGSVAGATVNEQYRYDQLQRLTNSTVTSSGSTTTLWYQYDNVGNRILQSLNGTVTTYTYNPTNNELVRSSNPTTTTTFAYDKNGNLLNKNVTTSGTVKWYYAWDASNRLLKATNGTGNVLYTYDGIGRMAEAIESGSTWYFAYTGTEILYENLLNTSNSAYLYAAGLRLCDAVNVNGAMYYYHTDAIGSTRIITYANATYAYVNNYLPFGQNNGNPTGNLKSSETDRFAGKRWSAATGLFNFYRRWYDPSVGLFISADPKPGRLSAPQSLNQYSYVGNDPASLSDPSGEGLWGAITSFVTNTANAVLTTTVHTVNAVASVATQVVDTSIKLGTQAVNTIATTAVNVGQTIVKDAQATVDTVVNTWNHLDSNTKMMIVSIAIIGVVIATGGLAAPILVGMAIGGGISGGLYAATCQNSSEGCSLEGFGAHALSGAAIGALGGVAGPLAGSAVDALGGTAGGAFSTLLEGGITGAGQAGIDAAGGKSTQQIGGDFLLSLGTAGIGDEFFPTKGMDTVDQVGFPSLRSFGRALMGSSEHTFNANMIMQGDVATSLIGEAVDKYLFGN